MTYWVDRALAAEARVREFEEAAEAQLCGGCRNLGNHRRHCPRHPDYHPWLKLADVAEDLGDRIGPNLDGLANHAYLIAGRLRDEVQQRREAAEYWRGPGAKPTPEEAEFIRNLPWDELPQARILRRDKDDE